MPGESDHHGALRDALRAHIRTHLWRLVLTGLVASSLSLLYSIYHQELGLGFFDFKSEDFESPINRLLYTIKLLPLTSLPLLWSMMDMFWWRARYPDTALDPLQTAGTPRPSLERASRILGNTVEQTSLHVLNLLGFALLVKAEFFHLTPLLVFLFLSGRLLFWIGYTIGAEHRSPGFALTFMPTLVTLIFNLLRLCGLEY